MIILKMWGWTCLIWTGQGSPLLTKPPKYSLAISRSPFRQCTVWKENTSSKSQLRTGKPRILNSLGPFPVQSGTRNQSRRRFRGPPTSCGGICGLRLLKRQPKTSFRWSTTYKSPKIGQILRNSTERRNQLEGEWEKREQFVGMLR